MNKRQNQSRPAKASALSQMEVHKKVARQSMARLAETPAATAITVLVIAVALLLPALLYLFQLNLSNGLGELDQSARMSVYLEIGLSDSKALDVSDRLQTWDEIESLELISSTEALNRFSESAGFTDVLNSLSSNPLPATIVVTPVATDLSVLSALESELLALPEVMEVELDRAWISRLRAVSELLRFLGQALLVMVLMGLFAIVGNTVRLSIESRREEIRVQKLVGATDAYIARPFLYSGFLLGAIGGVFACMFLLLLGGLLGAKVAELAALYNNGFGLIDLSFLANLALILIGAGAGWLAAFVASYRNIATIDA